MVADRRGDLFYLRGRTQQTCNLTTSGKTEAELWHDRLCHTNFQDMNTMLKREKTIGLKFNYASTPNSYDTCLAGKFTSLPFPTRGERTPGILDIVHTDLCGPMRTTSLGGARYFITFIDDYSKWYEVHSV